MTPVFDRIPVFDERSRGFDIKDTVPKAIKSKVWNLKPRINQGDTEGCVGHAFAHELAATPKIVAVSSVRARQIYREARRIDNIPGEYDRGTSVLAGAKIVQRHGFIRGYRWAFDIEGVMLAVVHEGPVVVGTPWLEGMLHPRRGAPLNVSGRPVGGHAYLIRGVYPNTGQFLLSNSWGRGWGAGGDAMIRIDDLDRLLRMDGECCVPVGRSTKGRW